MKNLLCLVACCSFVIACAHNPQVKEQDRDIHNRYDGWWVAETGETEFNQRTGQYELTCPAYRNKWSFKVADGVAKLSRGPEHHTFVDANGRFYLRIPTNAHYMGGPKISMVLQGDLSGTPATGTVTMGFVGAGYRGCVTAVTYRLDRELTFSEALTAYVRGNYVKSAQLMRSLALKGDQEAQTYLGQMYAMGYGRVRDHGKAVYWYRKAAEQGEAQAQNNLGVAYAEGQGLPRNYKLAYAWYSLAASQGYGQATANRETIVGRMSSAQIEEAETLSRELAERIASSH